MTPLLLLKIIADCFDWGSGGAEVDSDSFIIGSSNVSKDGSSVFVFVEDVVCGNGGGWGCSRDIVPVSVGQERVSKISGCSSICGNVRGLW